MTATDVLATLREAGVRVTLAGDDQISLVPSPPPQLLAQAIAAKPVLLRLLAAAIEPEPDAPPPELIQRLAAALAIPTPWQRIADPTKAAAYFEAEAIRRLLAARPEDRVGLVAALERLAELRAAR